jgi:coenzyme F420-reducing hydrogenase delta subunit/ferredoxin
VALVCNWCTYAGADLAGTSRREYPASVRIVRFPCTGRIGPLAVLRAFASGADGVVVSGCHPGDCHYAQGNLHARRRFALMRSLMEILGLDERRLHFAWVSASEGGKWAGLVERVTAAVKEAGPLVGDGEEAAPPPSLSLDSDSPAEFRPRAAWESWEGEIRRSAEALLREGRAACVVGFAPRGRLGKVAPVFVTRPEEAGRLVWNESCHQNLAVHLLGALSRWPKVGVVAKACDSRSVEVLIQENQIARESLVILGAPCGGMGDGRGAHSKCATCDGLPGTDGDVVISAAGRFGGASSGTDSRDGELDRLLALPPEKRWSFWGAQFSNCIRCYACRAACPLCYCKVCITDRHRPSWVSSVHGEEGNRAWHAVRAFHLAGRCVGCDACARACPAHIRLDLLNRHLIREVETRFGYKSGETAEAPPLLSTFAADDGEEFVL